MGAAFLYLLTGPSLYGRRRQRDRQQVCRTIFQMLHRANYSPRVTGARISLFSMTALVHVSCKRTTGNCHGGGEWREPSQLPWQGSPATVGRRRRGEAAEADSQSLSAPIIQLRLSKYRQRARLWNMHWPLMGYGKIATPNMIGFGHPARCYGRDHQTRLGI